MADDRTVKVRATGSPAAVERLLEALHQFAEDVRGEGTYQRNGGRVALYAEVRLPASITQKGSA